jgi:dienelactone hydrolase
MAKWCGIVCLALWLAGSLTAYLATFLGVIAEPITLPLSAAVSIRGTLYHRPWDKGRLPGVVVLHATTLSHRSCGPALSVPLARQGFLVLAIDLLGHGASGGSRPRREFADLQQLLRTRAEHPEIDAALDFLKAHPRVDPDRLALVGHSLGGWAAVDSGCRRADVGSVVSLGAAPLTCDPARPPNFLLLTSDLDGLSPPGKSARAMALACGGVVPQPRRLVGTFPTGTARQWVVLPGSYHLSQLVDPAVSRYVVGWVGSSLRHKTGRNPGTRLLLAVFGTLLATFGGAFAVARLLSPGPPSPRPGPVRPARGRAAARLLLVACLLVVASPATAFLAGHLEMGPVQFAAPTLVLFAAAATICLGGAAAVPRRQQEKGLPPPASPRSRWPVARCSVALGGQALGLAFVWLGVPWRLTWGELVPTPPRFLLALALLPLLFPWCLLLALGLRRALPGWEGGLFRGLVWVSLPVLVWIGHQWFAVDSWPFFTVPVWFLGGSFLVPLPLWLMPDRPGVSVARALAHAGGAAWLLACHLPFVHSV